MWRKGAPFLNSSEIGKTWHDNRSKSKKIPKDILANNVKVPDCEKIDIYPTLTELTKRSRDHYSRLKSYFETSD